VNEAKMLRGALGASDPIARAIIRQEYPEPGEVEEHFSSNNFARQRRNPGKSAKRGRAIPIRQLDS
jgi:hypothetical protein